MNAKILLVFAPFGVKNILLCAIKKTSMSIAFIGLHPENGGICAHRELNHKLTVSSEQWTEKSRGKSEE
jgi:hypothetical protein